MFGAAAAGFVLGAGGTLMVFETMKKSSASSEGGVANGTVQPTTSGMASGGVPENDAFIREASRFGLPLGGSQMVKYVQGAPRPVQYVAEGDNHAAALHSSSAAATAGGKKQKGAAATMHPAPPESAPVHKSAVEYIASMNYERRVPDWVLEYFGPADPARGITSQSDAAKAVEGKRTSSKFSADMLVPSFFRATNADYTDGDRFGLSRGHLAPAQLHKSSQPSMNSTFTLSSNIAPQELTVNGGEWFRLEEMTKFAMKRYFTKGCWVVTGPVFAPISLTSGGAKKSDACYPAPLPLLEGSGGKNTTASAQSQQQLKYVCYPVVGDQNVAVPTHFYKVILGETADNKLASAAFVIPNRPIVGERPLSEYLVPISKLEQMVGKEFFPNSGAKEIMKVEKKHDVMKQQQQAPQSSSVDYMYALSGPSVVKQAFDLCSKHKGVCEGKSNRAPFATQYSMMAQLRSCNTRRELELVHQKVLADQAARAAAKQQESNSSSSGGLTPAAAVEKDFNRLMKLLPA